MFNYSIELYEIFNLVKFLKMFKTEFASIGAEYGSMCQDMNDMTEESNDVIRTFFNNVQFFHYHYYISPELHQAIWSYNNEINETLRKCQWFKHGGLIENINMVGSYSERQVYIILYLQKYEAFVRYFEIYLTENDLNILKSSRDTMHAVLKDHDTYCKTQLAVSDSINGFLNSNNTPIQSAVKELITKENPFGH